MVKSDWVLASNNAATRRVAKIVAGGWSEAKTSGRLIIFNLIRNRRSWSNNAHITAHHVEKLRQFVEARLAQKLAGARDPFVSPKLKNRALVVTQIRIGTSIDVGTLIFTVRCIVRANLHRSKLVEKKDAAVHADAFLLVENRAARIQLDQQSDQQPQRGQHRQRQRSNQ